MTLRSAVLNLVPIVLSLAITAVLIVLVGRNPLEVAQLVLSGSLGSLSNFANAVNFWIPLGLCAVGLVVTFRVGLYNIHVEGQIMAGAIASSWVALYVTGLPAGLHIALAVVAGALGGAFTGAIVGLLKTRLGVNEIFGGVAMNALVSLYSIYLISGPWQPAEGGSAQSSTPFPPSVWLNPLTPEFPINLPLLVVAAILIMIVGWLLAGTSWGLQLKATGRNPRSALLLGVPVSGSTVSAMVVCGILAGVAGSHRVLFNYQSLRPLVSGGIGFLALLVVLLASVRLVRSVVIAAVFAVILAGSTRLKITLKLDESLVGVLQGLIVLTVLLFNGIRQQHATKGDSTDGSPAD